MMDRPAIFAWPRQAPTNRIKAYAADAIATALKAFYAAGNVDRLGFSRGQQKAAAAAINGRSFRQEALLPVHREDGRPGGWTREGNIRGPQTTLEGLAGLEARPLRRVAGLSARTNRGTTYRNLILQKIYPDLDIVFPCHHA